MIAMQPQVSADFLADLALVCPEDRNGSLPSEFFKDLETAYAHVASCSLHEPLISLADLASLAQHLKAWRSHRVGGFA